MKGETDGLLVAAQEQEINTRNYQKVICGQQVESKCRLCSQHEETVDHIESGCEVLTKTEYISRHNNDAAYLHWSICKDHDIEITDKKYSFSLRVIETQSRHFSTVLTVSQDILDVPLLSAADQAFVAQQRGEQ